MKRSISWVVAAWAVAGCVPQLRVPSVNEPLDSPRWSQCAQEAARREQRSVVDDLSLDAVRLLCRAVAVASEDEKQAMALLDEAATRSPQDYRPVYLKARILRSTGRFVAALDAYAQARKRDSRVVVPTRELAQEVAARQGEVTALGFIDAARQRDLCHYDCRSYQGQLLRSQGLFDDAVAVYEALVRQEPENPVAYVGLAAIHNARGQFDQEAAMLAKAISAVGFGDLDDAYQAQVYYSYAFALYNAGDFMAAQQALQKALVLHNEASWLLLAGWIALRLDNPAMALVQFEKSLAMDATSAAAMGGRGDALLALERFADAQAAFDAAAEQEPDAPLWPAKAALAAARAGRIEQAVARWRRAVQIGRTNLPQDLVDALRAALGDRFSFSEEAAEAAGETADTDASDAGSQPDGEAAAQDQEPAEDQ